MKEIDELKKIYINSEIDTETRLDNEEWIAEFEATYRHTEAYATWQDSDITKEIARKARETYVDASILLATSRTLSESDRQRLWAEQDAARWLLGLTETDAKASLAAMQNTIRSRISATK